MAISSLNPRKAAATFAIDPALIDTLEADFRGEVILPCDEDYEAARQVWNATVDKYPGVIARCAATTDIVSAVKFARANELRVSIRGGGNNVAGRAVCDNGLVIDLSAMKGILVDPQRREVRVQAGALIGELDRETHAYGLAVPAGVYSGTGIAGLTLGGGVGWLARKYGLTCDNLLSCEVVTADGVLITASEDINADLFWGLRGGGGLCVVSSFLFQAQPVCSVLGGMLLYRRDQAAAVLRHYRDFMGTAPEELTAYAGLVTGPDGRPAVAVMACWCGDATEGEHVLQPLRDFGKPTLDTIQKMPFPAMQTILDDSFPERSCNYWKSTFLTALTDDAIDVIVAHGNRAQSPLSSIMIEFYGGAPGRIGHADTAFSLRQPDYNISIRAQWTRPIEGARHIGWARELWLALTPHSTGGFMTNLSSDIGENANRAMYGSNYPRLAELRSKYDPAGFFNPARPIPGR
jgi:hypothetical protein